MKEMLKICMLNIMVMSMAAFSATLVWQPTQDGVEWDTPAAWDLGYVPQADDVAEITSVFSAEINSATAALKELNMGTGDTAVLNINDGGTLNMGGGGHINIGRRGHSQINVYEGGSIICENGARISLHWSNDSVLNQYGGLVEPHTLLNLADNSVYNMMGGKLSILGSKGNASLSVGNSNSLESIFNLSGGEVEIVGSGWLAVGRAGGIGTVNQTGGYMNASDCNVDVWLARDGGDVGIYNLSGGELEINRRFFVGNDGYGELNISGGTLTTNDTVRLGVGEDAQGIVTISGGSINIGGFLQAASPHSVSDPNQYAELNIIGSKIENINLGGRLDFRDKYDAKINFVFDDGGITPIHAADHAVLEGSTISVDVAEGSALLVGSQMDVIVSDATVAMNQTTTVVNNSDIYDFTYEVVALDGGGQALRFTVTDVTFATCEDAINAGYALPGDLNQDCRVDLADFAIMAEYWLVCNDPTGAACQ